MTSKGKMIEWIYEANLTQRATLVIFYLINRADQMLTCFPSVGTIARECNISSRTVQRALNDLELSGFLERESRYHVRGGQRSNLYRLKKISIDELKEVGFGYLPVEDYSEQLEWEMGEENNLGAVEENHDGNAETICENIGMNNIETEGMKKKSRFQALKHTFLKWCQGVYDKFSPLEL